MLCKQVLPDTYTPLFILCFSPIHIRQFQIQWHFKFFPQLQLDLSRTSQPPSFRHGIGCFSGVAIKFSIVFEANRFFWLYFFCCRIGFHTSVHVRSRYTITIFVQLPVRLEWTHQLIALRYISSLIMFLEEYRYSTAIVKYMNRYPKHNNTCFYMRQTVIVTSQTVTLRKESRRILSPCQWWSLPHWNRHGLPPRIRSWQRYRHLACYF